MSQRGSCHREDLDSKNLSPPVARRRSVKERQCKFWYLGDNPTGSLTTFHDTHVSIHSCLQDKSWKPQSLDLEEISKVEPIKNLTTQLSLHPANANYQYYLSLLGL